MKFKYILFDGNNLYWRAFIKGAQKNKTQSKLVSSGIVEAFARIHKILKTYGREDTLCYFLFDNPTHEISVRKVISPTYKHPRDRKAVPAQLYQTLRTFQQILRSYSDNFHIVVAEKREADDFTKPILEHVKPTRHLPALCVSADMDWARNIVKDGSVQWYNWEKIMSHQVFFDKYGFIPTANSVKLYKSLRGDASDAIEPGVPRLPERIVLDIVERFSSVEDLLLSLWSSTFLCPLEWKQAIGNASSQLRVNWRLVDFVDTPLTYDQLVVRCKRSPRQARLWFETIGMPLEKWMKEKVSAPAFFQERVAASFKK